MAKRKRTTTKRRRRNPARARRAAKRVYRRGRSTIIGMNVFGALKGTVPRLGGALAAQWAAKRFAPGGGANDPEWSMSNYLFGGLGAFGAGAIAETLKRGTGQKVLEGGLLLLVYKAFINQIAAGSEWLTEQFGEDEMHPAYMLGQNEEEFEALMGAEEYEPGDAYVDGIGETYVMGQDRAWYPADESHRLPMTGYGETSAPPGQLGETSAPPGSLGVDPYSEALLGQVPGSSEDPYARIYDY